MDGLEGLVCTEVIAGEGAPMEVYLARIGVSDTLYADGVGNVFAKELASGDERQPLVPYDKNGVSYRAVIWNEASERNSFYSMNEQLISRAAEKASYFQCRSPLEPMPLNFSGEYSFIGESIMRPYAASA